MKRIFAFVLLICMLFSVCALTACNNSNNDITKNIYEDFEDFDSYVPKNSDIIGVWKMTSPTKDMEWQFFANTTLHCTKIDGEVRMTTVCTYNYDGEGNLKTYAFTEEVEESYAVEVNGNAMTLTDKDGEKLTFEKQ